MNFKTSLCFIITALILSGCSGLKLQKYPSEKCTVPPGEKTLIVIREKCLTCHKEDFADKEKICSRQSIIIDSVSSKRMPKFGKLNDDQLKTILKWDL